MHLNSYSLFSVNKYDPDNFDLSIVEFLEGNPVGEKIGRVYFDGSKERQLDIGCCLLKFLVKNKKAK